jgi:hypothetical protein
MDHFAGLDVSVNETSVGILDDASVRQCKRSRTKRRPWARCRQRRKRRGPQCLAPWNQSAFAFS